MPQPVPHQSVIDAHRGINQLLADVHVCAGQVVGQATYLHQAVAADRSLAALEAAVRRAREAIAAAQKSPGLGLPDGIGRAA